MRIGLDISKILPPRDGIGRYVRGLVRALAAAGEKRPGFELTLYGSLHAVAPEALDRLLPTMPPNVHLARSREPSEDDVDVFHATSWWVPRHYRGPLVFTCYDLTVLTHAEYHTVANRMHVLRGLLEARLANAMFVTLSNDTADALAHWFEVPPTRSRAIPPGTGERFSPCPASQVAPVLAQLGLDQPYVVAVGTREPRKNLGRLLDAWLALPNDLRATNDLVLVGRRGWHHAELDDRLENAVTRGVRLLEAVDDNALPALYTGATALAFPSLAEGFGLPVLEAMACGTPVITSNVSSLPEAAGDAARLVDPFDVAALAGALAAVLDDPAEAERLRAAGRSHVAAFTWNRCAEAMLALYDEVAGREIHAG